MIFISVVFLGRMRHLTGGSRVRLRDVRFATHSTSNSVHFYNNLGGVAQG